MNNQTDIGPVWLVLRLPIFKQCSVDLHLAEIPNLYYIS